MLALLSRNRDVVYSRLNIGVGNVGLCAEFVVQAWAIVAGP